MADERAFNQLSNAEAERLALLAEEAAEVVQAVGKILRHGYESTNPDGDRETTNRSALMKECGDFLAALSLATTAGDLHDASVKTYAEIKLRKVRRYLHHQEPTP